MAVKILRLVSVLDCVGTSKSSWYDWVRRGLAPAPVKLGPRAVGWRIEDIEAWLASRESARNADRAEAA